MMFNRQIHHRRSTRLPSWDYSWPWWYYVTIVVKERECRFGEVVNDQMNLSNLGKIAEDCWCQLPKHHKGVELDDYVIMPNHLHAIIVISDSPDERRDVQLNVLTEGGRALFPSRNEALGSLSPKKGTLSVIIRTFKAAVTTIARDKGFSDFAWQSRFYDHIIRNDADLLRIRTYIANNPLQWAIDEENPENMK